LDSISRQALLNGYERSFQIDVGPHVSAEATTIDLLECADCSLRWYSPLSTGGPDFYEALQKYDWYYQGEKPEYKHAASMIAGAASVLDVGCGRGAFASFLSGGQHYRGLEFNQVAVRKAKAEGLDVIVRSIEAEAEINPAAYDVVCHFQVLEHVEDPLGFMAACTRALKPGGTLMVTVPAEDSYLALVPNGWLNMPPHHLTRWTDKAIHHLVRKLGLTMMDIWHEPVADFHMASYRQVMSGFAVRDSLGIKARLQDPSLANRIANRIARMPALNGWLVKRGESHFGFSGRGNSVCFAARKRPSSLQIHPIDASHSTASTTLAGQDVIAGSGVPVEGQSRLRSGLRDIARLVVLRLCASGAGTSKGR